MGLTFFNYIYASNGTDGFLLDLVRRRDSAVARLALYSDKRPPLVLREVRDLSEYSGADGDLKASIGALKMGPDGCRGALGQIDIDLKYSMTRRSINFVPRWLHRLMPRIPYFTSHYGGLQDGTCQEIFFENLPMVYSTYRVRNIERARWYLISATRFAGSDLSFEISASRVFGLWGASAYIYFQGKQYRLNNPLASLIRFKTREAGDVSGGERLFAVSIRTRRISIEVMAKAPVSDFALLEREGSTTINTTLFGDCDARVTVSDGAKGRQRFDLKAERTCLLEVKNY